ncbi:tRNA-dihydrouridine synthase 2-like protein [Syncephalis pseudoplumigaleata]|uniref:tRNA-dihydrouridine synthase 2-like protein n=1 Tax=Syncephalis pseudoplumigaleata TaxID=1712513 RepID=A0A4P9Z0Y9_9FUNG|nr:tRNA-dihydrouridine synthase 2-like protein [Syncephalis pseudoplumigaleata]|eukprot:RKP26086.1 tRNA-dihydrouridine synthase 2-like protein [Syncephalis pseudoplumigaleata]
MVYCPALYINKHILAPMVRVGTLPMRLLSLDYGADLVYSPEIVDKAIIGSERTVDEVTGTIRYIKDGRTVIQIDPREKHQLIFQLGTADPELALKAALCVKEDVAAIDVNCGCPKKFSIAGGMGAALLTVPDKLCSILTNLVEHVGLPVSCKIRLLESREDTLALCRRVAATGISALAVHCRTRDERPRHPAHWDELEPICQAIKNIPIIANGDFAHRDDIEKMRAKGNKHAACVSSIMYARSAMHNPSLFRQEGPLARRVVAIAYIQLARKVNNIFQNTKYTLMQMYEDTKSPEYQRLTSAKTMDAIW